MTNPKNNRTIGIYLILILLTVISFWPVQDREFVGYDDPEYVTENPQVSKGLTLQNIGWAFATPPPYNWHPLTWISHMLDCQLFGMNATWHHLHNLILHLVNALLLFELMRRMTGAKWPSAFVAAAFALHPMHVESVTWVAERKDVLSTLFWMLVMIAYLRYVEHPKKSRYLLVVALFIMGLMTKPMLVTVPFVLLLVDYWPLERMYLRQSGRKGAKSMSSQAIPEKLSLGKLFIEKTPLFALSVCSCIITFLVKIRGGSMAQRGNIPLSTRMANAMMSYTTYIQKMFVPKNLAVLYPYPAEGFALYKPIAALVILILITIFVVRFARRKPYLFTGWFWYLGTLIPVIGIVQVGIQAMADRYTYISYTGLFIIVAWMAKDISAGWKKQKIVLTILAAITLTGMTIMTRMQLKYWKNSMTLCRHALDVTDNNFMMHYGMGSEMEKLNRPSDAEHHFRRAIEINPNYSPSYIGLGNAFWRRGEPEKAADFYRKALKINPDDQRANYNLATVLKAQKEAELYRKALDVNPDDPLANYNMGIILQAQGRLDEANAYFHKVNLADISSKLNLVRLLVGNDQFVLAIMQLQEVLNIKQDNLEALNNLAWIFAACKDEQYRDPAEAVKLAQAACRLTDNKNAVVLDTLAVAYAASGQFEKAVDTARKALSLIGETGNEELRKQIETRLALFSQQQSYVDQ